MKGREAVLPESGHHLGTRGKRFARRLVQIGAELRKGGELAVLGKTRAQRGGDLLHELRLRCTSDTRDRKTDVDRRALALVEEVSFEEDLAVGDGNDVRRDVSGDIARLRLDDGQRRDAAAAGLGVDARGAFEQTGMQIEDIAGVRFASGRTVQQQGDLTVRYGVLGEIVVSTSRPLYMKYSLIAAPANGAIY